MINVTVRRSRWLRGEGSTYSSLYRSEDGRMCCLGFACEALGYQVEDIRDISSPNELDTPTIWEGLEALERFNGDYVCGPVTRQLMEYNDDKLLPDSEREAKIAALGSKIGIKFTFED